MQKLLVEISSESVVVAQYKKKFMKDLRKSMYEVCITDYEVKLKIILSIIWG